MSHTAETAAALAAGGASRRGSYEALASVTDRHRLSFLRGAQPPLALFPGRNEPSMPAARPESPLMSHRGDSPRLRRGASSSSMEWDAEYQDPRAPTEASLRATRPTAAAAAVAHTGDYLHRAHANEDGATAELAALLRERRRPGGAAAAEAAAHLLSLKVTARVADLVWAQIQVGSGPDWVPTRSGSVEGVWGGGAGGGGGAYGWGAGAVEGVEQRRRLSLSRSLYIYIYIYMHVYASIYLSLYLYLSIYIYIYIYMCICIYIYIYLNMYVCMYIYIYIYIYIIYIYIYSLFAIKRTSGVLAPYKRKSYLRIPVAQPQENESRTPPGEPCI